MDEITKKKVKEGNKEVSIISNKNKFIAFRKDCSINKINSSYCIVETDNKIVRFDIKDNSEFLNKSNLEMNIKALKEEVNQSNSESKIKKIRPQSSNLHENSNKLSRENNLIKKQITEKILLGDDLNCIGYKLSEENFLTKKNIEKSDKDFEKEINLNFEGEKFNKIKNIESNKSIKYINQTEINSNENKKVPNIDEIPVIQSEKKKNLLVEIDKNQQKTEKICPKNKLNFDSITMSGKLDFDGKIISVNNDKNKIANFHESPINEESSESLRDTHLKNLTTENDIKSVKDTIIGTKVTRCDGKFLDDDLMFIGGEHENLSVKNECFPFQSIDNNKNENIKEINSDLNQKNISNVSEIEDMIDNPFEKLKINKEYETKLFTLFKSKTNKNDENPLSNLQSETSEKQDIYYKINEEKSVRNICHEKKSSNDEIENINDEEECKIIYQIDDFDNTAKIHNFEEKTNIKNLKNRNSNLKKSDKISSYKEKQKEKQNKINFNLTHNVNEDVVIRSNINLLGNHDKNLETEMNLNAKNVNKSSIITSDKSNKINDLNNLGFPVFTKFYKSSPKINFVVKNKITKKSSKQETINNQEIEDENLENSNKSIKTVEDNSLNYPFNYCYICDGLNPMDFTYTTELCLHSICQKCIKAFYESKIEAKEFSFKCPIFCCYSKYKEEVIKQFVSESHFKNYMVSSAASSNPKIDQVNNVNIKIGTNLNQNTFGEELNSNKQKTQENRANTFINLKSPDFQRKSSNLENKENVNFNADLMKIKSFKDDKNNEFYYHNIKDYTKKNIAEVNNLNGFMKFNQNKDNFCKKCNEPALFSRAGKSSVKCLNCFTTLCKYCLKSITFDHFDLNSLNYCRVYFRRKLKLISMKNTNKLKNFLLSFLMLIASYLLFFINCFSYLSKFIKIITCLSKFEKKLKFFYFINRNNFLKLVYLQKILDKKRRSLDDEKNRLSEIDKKKSKEIIAIYPVNSKCINFEKNKIIKISKNENENPLHNTEEGKRERMFKKESSEIRCSLPFEDENKCEDINFNDINSENIYLGNDLISILKINLKSRDYFSKLKMKKVGSYPDKDVFYLDSKNEKKKKKSYIMQFIKNSQLKENYIIDDPNGNMQIIHDNIFLKTIKLFVFYLLFIPIGLILLLILLLIIPYFPLIILLFQI